MRSIKFRAWDKEVEEMINVARFDFADYTIYTHLFADGGRLAENCYIMQFTGLTDKNGKEIYEGDVVIGSHRSQRDDEQMFIEQSVTFLNGCFMFGNWNAHEYFNMHRGIEVIGNVYQDKHLLEGEE